MPLKKLVQSGEGEERLGEEHDTGEEGGPSHTKRQKAGFKTTREVAVPVQPVIQSAGYSASGGVQVKPLSEFRVWEGLCR
jgi:hypothetical protein